MPEDTLHSDNHVDRTFDVGELAKSLKQDFDAIIACDADGDVLFVENHDPAFKQTAQNAINDSIFSLTNDEHTETLHKLLHDLVIDNSVDRSTVEVQLKLSGSILSWYEAHVSFQSEHDVILFCLKNIDQRKSSEQMLVDQVRFKEQIIETSPSVLYVYDRRTNDLVEGLQQYAKLLGVKPERIAASQDRTILEFVHHDDRNAVEAQIRELEAQEPGTTVPVEARLKHSDGHWIWIRGLSKILEVDEQGNPIIEIGSVFDITERKQIEATLNRSEKHFRSLVENSYDGIVVFDFQGLIKYASPSVTRITGYTLEDLLGTDGTQWIVESAAGDIEKVRTSMTDRDFESMVLEWNIRKKDGDTCWVECRVSNYLRDEDINGIIVNFHDISERKRSESRIRKLANYDDLTGLPNRRHFLELVEAVMKNNRRADGSLSLLYIDIDHFKDVNDSLNHKVGDEVLKSISASLKSMLSSNATLSRVGGDEFAILLINKSKEAVEALAQKIVKQFAEPFQTELVPIKLGVSIGIASYPDDAHNFNSLISCADVAMAQAKAKRSSYEFYRSEEVRSVSDRIKLEKKLKIAIENDDLSLYYQPRIDLFSGEIDSLEALLRWYDPASGDISPAEIIPIAESTGIIHALGTWVTHAACRQHVAWSQKGLTYPIAINLSAEELQDVDIVRKIYGKMQEFSLEPSCLEIEITESAAMTDVSHTVKILNQFNELGIDLSIDDFGTGYSSLAYLSRLPVQNLKIDKYFVSEVGKRNFSRSANINIIRSIVSLAQSLDLNIVAEGVETIQQESFLKSLGCNRAQGWLYSKAMAPAAIEELLHKGHVNVARGA